ncbi:MAG: hypothetical protein ABTR07_13375 [Candidatus Competibacter denitrificans]
MIKKQWKLISGVALALATTQGAFAGQSWLLIISDKPESAIFVDNVYRGVTPQRPGDALRLEIKAGARVIGARKQFKGREYTAVKTVKIPKRAGENVVRFNLHEEEAVADPKQPLTATVQTSSRPRFEATVLPTDLEVPGRNF